MAKTQRRKRREDALHTNEERYRLATRATRDVIWDWDMVTDQVVWGEAMSEVFGYSTDQVPCILVGARQWWIAHVHPEDVEQALASFLTFYQSAADTSCVDYRFQRADGSYAMVADRVSIVRSTTGTPVRVVGAMSDITARKQTEEALRLRARQQAAVAALGQAALRDTDLTALMQEASAMLAHVLDVEYCKVLELLPGGDAMLLRAGVGWKDGYVGHTIVDAWAKSQAGYTLLSQTPVIVEDLRTEAGFHGPPLLLEHDVVSGMSVIIHGQDQPFGILGVHTVTRRVFAPDDIHFLQAIANVLATAVQYQRAHQVLRESEERYRIVTETVADAIIAIDAEGKISFINRAVETIFGYSRADVVGLPLTVLMPERLQVLHQAALHQYIDTHERRIPWEAVELTGRHKDGHEIPLEISFAECVKDGKPTFIGLARDITDRKQAAEKLLLRTRELEAMVAIAEVLAGPEPFEVKARKMLVTMNTLAGGDMAVMRVPAEEEPGLRTIADSGPGRLRTQPRQLIKYGYSISTLAYESGEPIVVNDYAAQARAHPDVVAQGVNSVVGFPLKVGERTLGVVSLTAGAKQHFTPERVQLLTAVASELGVLVENARLREETEHRLAEIHAAHEQLQSLSQRLFEAQEVERRHIARELHDEIGQLVTALQLLLDITVRSPAEQMTTNLSKMQALLQELMGRVRNLSLDLRPPMLDDLGLLPTLLWHFKRYTTQSQVAVEFKHAGIEGRRFLPAIETAAFRIVQEALTNVVRHARVKHVAVRLWTTDTTLDVQIEDQGVGFDQHTSAVGHLGLVGMRERVQLLSGTLTIEAAPGAGTRITAEWPLTRQDRGAGAGAWT